MSNFLPFIYSYKQKVTSVFSNRHSDGSRQRICLPRQETQVLSLDQKEPLEEEMATHSSILAWEISWR